MALGDGGTAWALDASGSLWFRTGVCSSRPQGDDDHWWQVQTQPEFYLSSCLTSALQPDCLSPSGQYFGLCGLRSGQSVPDAVAGHTKRCHCNQGASGAGGSLFVPVLTVPAKPGQCQC